MEAQVQMCELNVAPSAIMALNNELDDTLSPTVIGSSISFDIINADQAYEDNSAARKTFVDEATLAPKLRTDLIGH